MEKINKTNLLDEIKNLCKQNNITPSRSKGQNFLIDEETYDKIVDSAGLNKDDLVLEIGPGLGILTEKLAKRVRKVMAVELDDPSANYLRNKFKEVENIDIINEDILKIDLPKIGLKKGKYKIVSNLPYNISSIFLRTFLTINPPASMTLMLQKEVAERIIAKPPEMSILAVSVQYFADAEIISCVNKDNFWPQPEVDSAIIKIDLRKKIESDVDKEKRFFQLVKIGFSSRRKMLKNNLMSGYKIDQETAKDRLKSAGLSEKVRAQDLSVEDWKNLFVLFS